MTKSELIEKLQAKSKLAYELYQNNPDKYSMNYLFQEGRWNAFEECIKLINDN